MKPEHLRWLSYAILFAAFAASWVWLVLTWEWESFITTLTLLSTIIVLFADRHATAKEQSRRRLRVLQHELFRNRQILMSPVFTHPPAEGGYYYPRLNTAGIDAGLASGEYHELADTKFFRLMAEWQRRAHMLNARLSVLDAMLSSPTVTAQQLDSARTFGQSSLFMETQETLTALANHMAEKYGADTGLRADEDYYESQS